MVRARDGPMVTTKTSIKAKARTKVRAFRKFGGISRPRPRLRPRFASLVLFGLLLRRCQALEAFQKLLLGHALDGDLGIVGIDAATGRADQGHRIGFRLVHLDQFLHLLPPSLTPLPVPNRPPPPFPS